MGHPSKMELSGSFLLIYLLAPLFLDYVNHPCYSHVFIKYSRGNLFMLCFLSGLDSIWKSILEWVVVFLN